MHGLLGVELPLEEVGDLRQVSQVKLKSMSINTILLKADVYVIVTT